MIARAKTAKFFLFWIIVVALLTACIFIYTETSFHARHTNAIFTDNSKTKIRIESDSIKNSKFIKNGISLADKIKEIKSSKSIGKSNLIDLIYDKSLTPDDATNIYKYVSANFQNLDDKTNLLSAIISSLVSNGYVNEAWGMISEDMGSLRDSQIQSFFTSSPEPGDMSFLRFEKIDTTRDKKSALDGICNRLFIPFSGGETFGLSETDFSNLGNLTDLQKRQISSYFINYGSNSAPDGIYLPKRTQAQQDVLQIKSLELVKLGIMNSEELRSVLRSTNNSTFENWEILNKAFTDNARLQVDTMAFSEQIRDMTEQDPIRTIQVLQKSSRKEDGYLIEIATKRWLEFNVKDAGDWYATAGPTMLPEHRERVALAYLRFGIQEGDTESASLWADHIIDPNLKSIVVEEIRLAVEAKN